MNSDKFLAHSHIGFFPKVVDSLCHPFDATSWLFILDAGVCIKSSSILDHGNLWSHRFAQDLAEPETCDAEAAYISTSHNRAVKVLTRRLWQWRLKEQRWQSHKHAWRGNRSQYNAIRLLWKTKPITVTMRSTPTHEGKIVRYIKNSIWAKTHKRKTAQFDSFAGLANQHMAWNILSQRKRTPTTVMMSPSEGMWNWPSERSQHDLSWRGTTRQWSGQTHRTRPRDPHLRRKWKHKRPTYLHRILSHWWNNHFDLRRGWRQLEKLHRHPLNNFFEHGGTAW